MLNKAHLNGYEERFNEDFDEGFQLGLKARWKEHFPELKELVDKALAEKIGELKCAGG